MERKPTTKTEGKENMIGSQDQVEGRRPFRVSKDSNKFNEKDQDFRDLGNDNIFDAPGNILSAFVHRRPNGVEVQMLRINIDETKSLISFIGATWTLIVYMFDLKVEKNKINTGRLSKYEADIKIVLNKMSLEP